MIWARKSNFGFLVSNLFSADRQLSKLLHRSWLGGKRKKIFSSQHPDLRLRKSIERLEAMIRIGKLILTKKAVEGIALLFFIQVIVIGLSVAVMYGTGKTYNIFLLFAVMLIPYCFLRKRIHEHILEN
jgi:hypothetical protein